MRDPHRRGGAGIRDLIDRRAFLTGTAALLAWPLVRPALAAEGGASAGPGDPTLPAATLAALESSPFVYVSPLKSDGQESACHGEVWFAWLDGAVILNTAPETWKTRAAVRGLSQARIWVGDHGRWRALIGHNESFRKAPSFEADVEVLKGDLSLVARVLSVYDTKYPAEIDRWRDKMRDGIRDGSRVLIRYTPRA